MSPDGDHMHDKSALAASDRTNAIPAAGTQRAVTETRYTRQGAHLSLQTVVMTFLAIIGLGLIIFSGLAAQRRFQDYSIYRAEQVRDDFRRLLRVSIVELDRASVDVMQPALGMEPDVPLEESLAVASSQLANAMERVEADPAYDGAQFIASVGPVRAHIESLRQQISQITLDDKQRIGMSHLLNLAASDLRQIRLQFVDLAASPDMTIGMLLLTSDYALQLHDAAHFNTASYLAHVVDPLSSEAASSFVFLDDVKTLRFSAPTFLDVFQASGTNPQSAIWILSNTIETKFLPAQLAVASMLEAGENDVAKIATLVSASELVADQSEALLFQASAARDSYLKVRSAQEWRKFLLFVGMTSGVVILGLAIGVLFVRFVALPFSAIQNQMLRLAVGDLDRVAPVRTQLKDLVAMHDALRVFRANAIRRERLQAERFELHERIAAANREMRADLEAAANVQQLLLPKSGTAGQFRFESHFRPSSLIGGDMFDFLELHDGRVALFQIDVAGHGAAASLLSVAAHLEMWRALDAASGTKAVMEEINRNWWGELPFFTAILVMFDPESSTGRIVQAGHPYPLHVASDGTVAFLGRGGVPIGVTDLPEYEEIPVTLDPGDRLIVFSDGLYDLRDRHGENFGEERLEALVSRLARTGTIDLVPAIVKHLYDWADPEMNFDDMSLVIMERV